MAALPDRTRPVRLCPHRARLGAALPALPAGQHDRGGRVPAAPLRGQRPARGLLVLPARARRAPLGLPADRNHRPHRCRAGGARCFGLFVLTERRSVAFGVAPAVVGFVYWAAAVLPDHPRARERPRLPLAGQLHLARRQQPRDRRPHPHRPALHRARRADAGERALPGATPLAAGLPAAAAPAHPADPRANPRAQPALRRVGAVRPAPPVSGV